MSDGAMNVDAPSDDLGSATRGKSEETLSLRGVLMLSAMGATLAGFLLAAVLREQPLREHSIWISAIGLGLTAISTIVGASKRGQGAALTAKAHDAWTVVLVSAGVLVGVIGIGLSVGGVQPCGADATADGPVTCSSVEPS